MVLVAMTYSVPEIPTISRYIPVAVGDAGSFRREIATARAKINRESRSSLAHLLLRAKVTAGDSKAGAVARPTQQGHPRHTARRQGWLAPPFGTVRAGFCRSVSNLFDAVITSDFLRQRTNRHFCLLVDDFAR